MTETALSPFSPNAERIRLAQARTAEFVFGLETGLTAGRDFNDLAPKDWNRNMILTLTVRAAYNSDAFYDKLFENSSRELDVLDALVAGMEEGVEYAIDKRIGEITA